MGYDIHITRKTNWFEEDGPEISLEEWIEVLQSDPEMRLDGFAEAATGNGKILRIKEPSMSVWTAYSRAGQDGNQAWLWLGRGCIVAKNPDLEIRRKMHGIAQRLSAKVQGDDGEIYGPNGEPAQLTFLWRFLKEFHRRASALIGGQ